jgi:hypothetical protein
MRSLLGGLAEGAPVLTEPRLDGGIFTVFPEPGRSDRPVLLAVGLRLGMPETESPRSLRFLVGIYGLTVTSSL